MNFLLPAAFWLFGLLLVVAALYLLKLRREERQVSSVYLWRRMVRDLEASAPWQKLRFNWLLLLQLLFLSVLIFSLARPFIWSNEISGQSVILILDSSASMSAVDSAPSRLEAAQKRARQIIDNLPSDALVTVIEAGYETQFRLASSRDRRQALQAVDNIRPGNGGSDLGMALELASAIASRQPDTRIVLLSDGRGVLPEQLTLRGQLDYLPVGLDNENQAISLLNVEPAAGGGWSVFAQVSNYGESEAHRRLSLYVDGQLANAYDLSIPAGSQQSALLDGLSIDAQLVEARLDGQDILDLDDQAFAVIRPAQPRRVVLISKGNLFLKTALALLPGIELVEMSPADTFGSDEADLFIYDGVLPQALPTSGSLLFVAPPVSTPLFTVNGAVQRPALRLVDPQDPLAQNLSLSGINLMDAVRLPLPEWAIPVILGDLPGESVPLLLRGQPDGRRVAVLAFDLSHSDLPMNIAFPMLCANLLEWLAPGAGEKTPAWIRPGETITLPVPQPAQASSQEAVFVSHPDGTSERARLVNGHLVTSNTSSLGVYYVDWGDGEQTRFAVNLFLPQESDLKPAGSLPGLASRENSAGGVSQAARQEWWRWPALLALVILVVEWLVYQRAGLARIRDFLVTKIIRIRLTDR